MGIRGRLKRFLGPRGLAAFRFASRLFWAILGFQAIVVFLIAFMNPPPGYYMISESQRLGAIKREWVDLEDMSPDMPRAVVAAEDANFCNHWGFDLDAIRAAVAGNDGRLRGASTISQQVTKNVFLWPARTWIRKALEAEMTIYVELFWTKRRIIEVYLNVAEFDEGVFGVGAASAHYFGTKPADITLLQAARLAAILPNPKDRSAINPSDMTRARTAQIMDGARTIAADGRDGCFVKKAD
ncbi:MAG: monofunctional biosynthetic peptidoglycan transglycosylase [Rhodobacteraceae bacterium]|nr:monofunctional biosynthetic peptidoglycan transglycosylase [Paracoccaceae bacterium]